MKLCLAACLLLTILVTYTTANGDESFKTLNLLTKLKRAAEERKRALAMEKIETRVIDDLKEKLDCKDEGQACNLVPGCCKEMQCFWPEGYSAKNFGVCVDCVKANQTCQRDSQCCEGMHCEKESTLYVDGVCQTSGEGGCIAEGQKCRTDGMCCGTELHCDKDDFYDLDGKCGRYRRSGKCYTDSQCVTACVRSKWYFFYGVCT